MSDCSENTQSEILSWEHILILARVSCQCPESEVRSKALHMPETQNTSVASHLTIYNRHALTTPDPSSERRGIACLAPLLSKEGVGGGCCRELAGTAH